MLEFQHAAEHGALRPDCKNECPTSYLAYLFVSVWQEPLTSEGLFAAFKHVHPVLAGLVENYPAVLWG
ncbi:MAG: hypothetical protein EBR26_01555 [Microbacteriaceae bacterium]|nr:hypothetical protein [Microbacteriaceae bacterium]